MTEQVVAIYGLGNIGFRHVQGLAPLADRVTLLGVDPSPEARDRARAAWSAAGGRGDFVAPEAAGGRPARLAILATSAHRRLDLLRHVLAAHRPAQVIAEKVVFQRVGDFDHAAEALRAAGAGAFVNCPRRYWPLHGWLSQQVAGRGPFRMAMRGADWGLGSNTVHMIDLFQMLTRRPEVACASAHVSAIIPSKRPGYCEVLGALEFTSGDGSRLTVEAGPQFAGSGGLVIEGEGWRWTIDEAAGEVRDEDGREVANLGRSPYQSELTHLAAASLLAGEGCALAALSESRLAHIPFLTALAGPFAEHGAPAEAGVPVS